MSAQQTTTIDGTLYVLAMVNGQPTFVPVAPKVAEPVATIEQPKAARRVVRRRTIKARPAIELVYDQFCPECGVGFTKPGLVKHNALRVGRKSCALWVRKAR